MAEDAEEFDGSKERYRRQLSALIKQKQMIYVWADKSSAFVEPVVNGLFADLINGLNHEISNKQKTLDNWGE